MRWRRVSDDQIVRWEAAAEKDDMCALLCLAKVAYYKPDFNEAEALWRRAVELGSTEAMHRLGLLLIKRDDKLEGEAVLRRGALEGDQEAIAALAQFLEFEGRTSESDEWYGKI